MRLQELSTWLSWVETWASVAGERGEVEELHERLQSHLQHCTEPSPVIVDTTTSGMPIVVVCMKADPMDNATEDVGVKGGGWEEKTVRAQQALRTVCLACMFIPSSLTMILIIDLTSAALFYTAPTQPTTYALLKSYLLHRPYTVPPPLNPPPTSPNTVSAPAIVGSTKFPIQPPSQLSEPSQNFLSRQLDLLMKDPNRDPRQSFRHAASATSSSNVPSATNPGA
ncbi:hypothetical protein B9479_008186, partial [Cryptococcus floricola]